MSSRAVRKITGVWSPSRRIRRHTSNPSSSGMFTSSTTRSGGVRLDGTQRVVAVALGPRPHTRRSEGRWRRDRSGTPRRRRPGSWRCARAASRLKVGEFPGSLLGGRWVPPQSASVSADSQEGHRTCPARWFMLHPGLRRKGMEMIDTKAETKSPSGKRSRPGLPWAIGLGLIAAMAVGGLFWFFAGDAPAEVDLTETVSAVEESPAVGAQRRDRGRVVGGHHRR